MVSTISWTRKAGVGSALDAQSSPPPTLDGKGWSEPRAGQRRKRTGPSGRRSSTGESGSRERQGRSV
eukprot:5874967-Heterocapsa_arctica.AAC.1